MNLIDLSVFPTTAEAVWTLVGAIVLAVLVTQWLKKSLPQWDLRFTNLLALGLMIVIYMAIAVWIMTGPLNTRIFTALLLAFLGATMATYGYETIMNLLGVAGVGPRATKPG